jgi:ABC-type transport system involved in multi-copper enzyme maturation permease subunit
MLPRELAIVLRARITWLIAALAALLCGHSFVLAVDLYTAGSRSVQAGTLMAREFDPLLGIIRPLLGGVYIAGSLLLPLLAARPLAVEKERKSLRVLLLQSAAPARVVLSKFLAALCGAALLLLGPLALLLLWRSAGGHLAIAETATALLGQALYLVLVAALALAAAAWTETVAQAAALTLVLVLFSWAVDAAEGFAALAWLGRAADWSVTSHLGSFEHGTLSLGDCAWMLAASVAALAAALLGARFDLPLRRRALWLLVIAASALFGLRAAARQPLALDLTELQRGSLPPAAVQAIKTLSGPMSVSVYLDRDDARRRQMESDVLARLRLARPGVKVVYPLDDLPAAGEGAHGEDYGRTLVCVAARCKASFSSSRKEIITVLFEAAGQPLPDWSQPEYPGYPLIMEGHRRSTILVFSYVLFPGLYLALGWLLTRATRRRVL